MQKRVIRNIYELTGTYTDKLKQVGVTTLADCRRRGDMIETFKIINTISDVKSDVWFTQTNQNSGQPTR